MTTLTITPDVAKKKLKLAGTVASGEKVAVTVAGFGTVSTTNLRLRVMAGDVPVGYFPLEDEDEWTVSGSDLTCTLDLATWQAERHCKFGAEVCFILEDTGTPQLYGVGGFSLRPWIKLTGVDVPKNLDNYKVQMTAVLAELDRVEALADGKYEKPSGGIPSSDMSQAVQTSLAKADTVTMKVSKSAFDSLLGLSLPDTATQKDTRIIVQRILGVLQSAATCIALMFALPSFGIDTTTAWEDVPPQTPVKSVVEAATSGAGFVRTNEQAVLGPVRKIPITLYQPDEPENWLEAWNLDWVRLVTGWTDEFWFRSRWGRPLDGLEDNDVVRWGEVTGHVGMVTGDLAPRSYVDGKQYRFLAYFVVTNVLLSPLDTGISDTPEHSFGGLAFGYYMSNSVYFVDEEVPTLKFFPPTRRSAYFGNNVTAVEIGDPLQVLRTYNFQADGTLAVRNPSCIRFMDTLEPDSGYDTGRSFSLQDYIDMFNPSFVGGILRQYQTNHADYVVGSISADSVNVGAVFSATTSGVAASQLSVSGGMNVSGGVSVPSFDDIKSNGSGLMQTVGVLCQQTIAPALSLSNVVVRGRATFDMSELPPRRIDIHVDDQLMRSFKVALENRCGYLWDAAKMDAASFSRSSQTWTGAKTNLVVDLPLPGGYRYEDGGVTNTVLEYLDITLTFDLTTVAHDVRLDIGSLNFANIGDGDGVWETVYSDVEPDVRVVPVYRETTTTTYNYIYDEDAGEWVFDYDNPVTTTTGWYDEYSMDMAWLIPAGSCKEFVFRQVGAKSMQVYVRQVYKTSPASE